MQVLIIDEHPLYCSGLATVIQDCFSGLSVMTETNLGNGYRACTEFKSSIELVLLGLDCADVNKYPVLSYLIQPACRFQLVVFPSFENINSYKFLISYGVKGIIPKYYSMFEIMSAFKEITSGRIHIPPTAKEVLIDYLRNTDAHNKLLKKLRVTKRQVEVLELMEKNMSNDQIAHTLAISMATVKTHINKLFRALEVTCRTECIKRSYELGVL